MSNVQHFRPDIDLALDYWCNSIPFQTNWQKTKLIVSHPTLPLILSCDEEQTLSIWNYSLSQLVWSRSSQQLVKDATGVPPVSLLQHVKFNPRRISHNSIRRIEGLTRNLNCVNLQTSADSTAKPGKDNTFGEVKTIDFSDTASLSHNGGYHNSRDVHIENRIIVLFDQAVIVYNYDIHSYSLITMKELDGKKPTSVEFIDDYNCAIGCNDGMTRIWNIPQARLGKTFGYSKSEISCLKTISFEK